MSLRQSIITREGRGVIVDALVATKLFKFATDESSVGCYIVNPQSNVEPMSMEESFALILNHKQVQNFDVKTRAHVVVVVFEAILSDPAEHAKNMHKTFVESTAENFYKSFSALKEERIYDKNVHNVIMTGLSFIRHRNEQYDPTQIQTALKWMKEGRPMEIDEAIQKRLGKEVSPAAESTKPIIEDTHICAIGEEEFPWNPSLGGLKINLEDIMAAKPDVKGHAVKNDMDVETVIAAYDAVTPEINDEAADYKTWTKQMTWAKLLSLFPHNGRKPRGVPNDEVHYFRSNPEEKQRMAVEIFKGSMRAYTEWIKSYPTIEFAIGSDGIPKLSNGNNQMINLVKFNDTIQHMEVKVKDEVVPCDVYMQSMLMQNMVNVKYTMAEAKKLEKYVDTLKRGREERFFQVMKDGPVKVLFTTIGAFQKTFKTAPTPKPVYCFTSQELLTLQQTLMYEDGGLEFLPDKVFGHYKAVYNRGYTAENGTVFEDTEYIYSMLLNTTSLRAELEYAVVKFELGDAWMSEIMWSFSVGHGITLRGKASHRVTALIDKKARNPNEIAKGFRAIAYLWKHVKVNRKYSVPSMVSFMPMVGDVLKDQDTETMQDAFDLIVFCKNVLPCPYGLSDEQFETYAALHELRFASMSNWTRDENCRFIVTQEEVTNASEALSRLEDYAGFKEAIDAALAAHKKVVADRIQAAKEAAAAKAAKADTGKRSHEDTTSGGEGGSKKKRN